MIAIEMFNLSLLIHVRIISQLLMPFTLIIEFSWASTPPFLGFILSH